METKTGSTLFLLSLAAILTVALAACGGGGGGDASWLFPLWVPSDIAVSDIDKDGRNDVLALARLSSSMSHNEGRLDVYRQTSQGNFPKLETYTVGEYPWQLEVSDLDDDGMPDLLVTDVDLDVVWLFQQNSGSSEQFLPQQQIASGLVAYSAVVADFNNDGVSDIALVDNRSGAKRIVMLYQNPLQPGTFLPAENVTLPGTSAAIAAGDLNGDDLADLLAWIYLEPTGYTPNGVLAISLQQPDGTLGPFTTLAPQTGLNVKKLTIADYNDDGANDLLLFFTPFSTEYNAKLTVILQNAEPGTFAAPVDTSLAGIKGIDDAVAADLNGDGQLDFAVVGFFPEGSPSVVYSRLNLFTQSGNGAFSLAGVYDITIPASRVAAGDIDGDGLDDLVVLGGENEVLALIQSHTMAGTFNSPNPL